MSRDKQKLLEKKYNFKSDYIKDFKIFRNEIIKKEIEQLIDRYGMSKEVSFLGEIKQNGIVDIMQKHHIFLTTKIYDPCSNTIIEAMSCGLPVIFHNSGGNLELVSDAGWGFGKKSKNLKKIRLTCIFTTT